ncbi:acyl-CoA-binding domain-containing protein 6-like isoform X2 [Xenopus laevis]|uniref:Acyl-CoA-binding domain-containing protein 6-like isoform X2 n=1 Tax=Xenopus laevis TaxID=8355 RepID=A0A8J1MXD9_XENLA|nr:acyl-CoA-binding domain-containing protein 6-like isoform X2 [Xenopus laevis]
MALEEPYKEPKTTFGGPVVSCLYKVQETLREEDKDIFDYCRENNISRVSHALSTGIMDVNIADDEGRSLLHWACDRGHTQLVSVVLFHNAHINIQDSEGQTPLHYVIGEFCLRHTMTTTRHKIWQENEGTNKM